MGCLCYICRTLCPQPNHTMDESDLDRLLGIDLDDPTQALANHLVAADAGFLRDLVDMRKRRGISQEEVARRMNITQSGVSVFERADSNPKLSTVRRYALAIGAVVNHTVQEVEL